MSIAFDKLATLKNFRATIKKIYSICVLFSRPPLWAVLIALLWLVLCCRWVGCPSVRLAVVVAVVPSNCGFCCRCLLFRCGFGLPLPFWAVLLPFLAVFGGGVVSLLVRCFSWQFGAFNGFVWWLACFWLVVVYPVPILESVWGVRITPSKFPKKFF